MRKSDFSITMESNVFTVDKVVGNTKAKVFKEFEEGDEILFASAIANKTGASNGLYAGRVRCVNLTKDIEVSKSEANMINMIERNFEISENKI